MIGASPMTSISRDMIRAMATPSNRSRTIAIATTETAAPANPCSTRTPASTAIVGAIAHSADAVAWAQMPTIRGRRRPRESDSGPITS